MVQVAVLRVFTDTGGSFGNHLGVVADGASVDPQDRLLIARKFGHSAVVYIDDLESGAFQIWTPGGELPFAGHPAVGTAWFIGRETGTPPSLLQPPSGPTPTWTDGPMTWVTGSLAGTPPWWHERLAAVADVEALDGPQRPEQDLTQLWAWEDEAAGTVRARVFAGRLDIAEDEACGSASMRLAAALGRPLTVRHGAGSMIGVRPGRLPGTADVGGLVVADPDQQL